jgi:phosphoglycolate phosphatase-like HAD superfamily hydrolase
VTTRLDVSRIQALCLDIDGTLVDSDDRLVKRLTRTLHPARALFRNQDPSPFARRVVMSAETPFNAFVVLADRLGLDGLVLPILEKMSGQSRRSHEAPLIPGISSALDWLRSRYRLAIVTARTHNSTQVFLKDHGLGSLFECVATASTCPRSKPHPAPLRWAADQMQVPVEACLMVGDTPIDMRTGVAAGAQTVGVLCGFGKQDELERAGADLILGSTAELPAVLRNP